MELNMSISIDDAKNIAKAIRNPMWDWHYYFGFALVIMVIYRIYLEIINPKKRRDYIYLTFYIFLLFMAISGVVLYFFKIGFLKEMHEIALYFFLVFIPFHIFKNRAIIR
jgi:cytochrome b561